LTSDSREALYRQHFVLSKDCNRTGGRLDGPLLQLQSPLELISEGSLPGTIQLPPSGQPIVLLGEAPVTGGYPRIGQVAAVDMPHLAQKRPGDRLRFQPVNMAEACQRLARQERQLEQLARTVQRRLESS
jgi:antagonist of KipI